MVQQNTTKSWNVGIIIHSGRRELQLWTMLVKWE